MPLSTRAAGAGGSSATMLKLFTDEAQGLGVDPLVVLFLAVGFIFSVIVLHVLAKITGKFTSQDCILIQIGKKMGCRLGCGKTGQSEVGVKETFDLDLYSY